MRTYLLPLYALLLLALAGPALAVDGVLEINQTCAVQTGCFSGDTAGYPVTITQSGSYRLTSNLRRAIQLGGSQNESFIEISIDDVSVDLGGFLISCATILGGSCSGDGSGVSTSVEPVVAGTSVRNGSITGMGLYGVLLGPQSEVSSLRVRRNGFEGITVSNGSTVSGNTAYLNGSTGISAGLGSTVSGNTAHFNGFAGITAGTGSTVSGNTAHNNGDDGIIASSGSTVSGNTAFRNGGDGIFASVGSTVQGNTVRENVGFGLFLGSDTGYRANVITLNVTGTVMGGVNAGGNVCNGLLTCP